MNAITEGCLKDLFTTEIWQEHFAALSDTLGFSLSIFAPSGKPILIPRGAPPLCRDLRASSAEFRSRCASHRSPLMMKALQTGGAEVFKCHVGITSFALPLEHLNEKAVVLGRGSYSSYEDFRACMNRLPAAGLDAITIPTPLTFTSFDHARKVCGFVANFVQRLIRNAQETVVLRKKFESLKSVVSMWSTAAEEPPETRFQGMFYNLSALLDVDRVTILTLDRQRNSYTGLYGVSKSGVETEAQSISAQDRVVRDLQGGRPFVLPRRPARRPRTRERPCIFPS